MTLSPTQTAARPTASRNARGPAPRSEPYRVVVVGGGVGGLAAAYYVAKAARACGEVSVTVVERDARAGGKVLTENVDGFVVEGGPDSLLASKPKAIELARELGLGERLLASDDARRRVWIARGERLVEVPSGLKLMVPTRLGPFLRSPLFSWSGKLRMLAERYISPRPAADAGEAESLADFVRRRLGREALTRLADPVMSSIHLGDPERLDLAATFPAFIEAERRHGSLTRAARHAARPVGSAPAAGSSRTDPARTTAQRAPQPLFHTLVGGLGELVDGLMSSLGRNPGSSVRLGEAVRSVSPLDGSPGFSVELGSGERLAADAVLLAVPASAAACMLASARPRLAQRLGELRSVSAATVALGYQAGALPDQPEGLGFFVPVAPDRAVVAATISSNKFPGRAPRGGTLLRAFVGGARGEQWSELSDDELVTRTRREVEPLLGIAATPDLIRVHRWPHGYPQYELGHRGRVAAIEEAAGDGLLLVGSAYHGAGIPDTLVSAERAAASAAEYLERLRTTTPAAASAAATR